MWKQIFDMAKRLLLLVEHTDRNRDEIKELQKQFRDLAAAFERLAYEIRRVSDKDDHEREKIILQLQNELLKLERRLPSAKTEEKPKDEA
jgi:archaellum component FlaC